MILRLLLVLLMCSFGIDASCCGIEPSDCLFVAVSMACQEGIEFCVTQDLNKARIFEEKLVAEKLTKESRHMDSSLCDRKLKAFRQEYTQYNNINPFNKLQRVMHPADYAAKCSSKLLLVPVAKIWYPEVVSKNNSCLYLHGIIGTVGVGYGLYHRRLVNNAIRAADAVVESKKQS
jgi:hypothetical protein